MRILTLSCYRFSSSFLVRLFYISASFSFARRFFRLFSLYSILACISRTYSCSWWLYCFSHADSFDRQRMRIEARSNFDRSSVFLNPCYYSYFSSEAFYFCSYCTSLVSYSSFWLLASSNEPQSSSRLTSSLAASIVVLLEVDSPNLFFSYLFLWTSDLCFSSKAAFSCDSFSSRYLSSE